MSEPSVYLAGPITGLSYDSATDWRKHAQKVLGDFGIIGLSPLRGKEFLREHGLLEDAYLDLHPLSTPSGITTRDRWDCTRADVVLANFQGADRVSIGTVMECAWADAARTPLVVVAEEGNVHRHAMIQQVAGYLVDDLATALDIVVAILHEG